MIRPDAHLVATVFSDAVEKRSTRDGFGTGTIEAGKADARVVVLCADLKESTRAEEFEKAFPDRFVEIGVAEQNLATVASGMARAGKIPFAASYAAFSPGRNYEQIRTTVALNRMPVIMCGMHAGVSVGPDGATHQMLEDIGLMRMLPHMTVVVPGDAEEAKKAVVAAAKHGGPIYIRFGRANTPVFTTPKTPFEIGKALTLFEAAAPKVAILSTGSLSYTALVAAHKLTASDIGTIVLHVPTVKPLDEKAVLAVATQVHAIVTLEEHQIAGGFGSAIAEFLSTTHPMPITRLGINDQFGQSGDPDELLAHYGLDAVGVEKAVRALKIR